MPDDESSEVPDRFRWTPSKIMLGEAVLFMLGIIALVPISFMGIGLSGVPEDQVPWWLNLYSSDLVFMILAAISIPVTGLIAFILWLARDK